MTISSVKRMVSKFEATGCLDDRPSSGPPSRSVSAARTVLGEMKIVACSSTHREVRALEVTRRTSHYCLGSITAYSSMFAKFKVIMNCFPVIL